MNINYYNKYLKYKNKYKYLTGGSNIEAEIIEDDTKIFIELCIESQETINNYYINDNDNVTIKSQLNTFINNRIDYIKNLNSILNEFKQSDEQLFSEINKIFTNYTIISINNDVDSIQNIKDYYKQELSEYKTQNKIKAIKNILDINIFNYSDIIDYIIKKLDEYKINDNNFDVINIFIIKKISKDDNTNKIKIDNTLLQKYKKIQIIDLTNIDKIYYQNNIDVYEINLYNKTINLENTLLKNTKNYILILLHYYDNNIIESFKNIITSFFERKKIKNADIILKLDEIKNFNNIDNIDINNKDIVIDTINTFFDLLINLNNLFVELIKSLIIDNRYKKADICCIYDIIKYIEILKYIINEVIKSPMTENINVTMELKTYTTDYIYYINIINQLLNSDIRYIDSLRYNDFYILNIIDHKEAHHFNTSDTDGYVTEIYMPLIKKTNELKKILNNNDLEKHIGIIKQAIENKFIITFDTLLNLQYIIVEIKKNNEQIQINKNKIITNINVHKEIKECNNSIDNINKLINTNKNKLNNISVLIETNTHKLNNISVLIETNKYNINSKTKAQTKIYDEINNIIKLQESNKNEIDSITKSKWSFKTKNSEYEKLLAENKKLLTNINQKNKEKKILDTDYKNLLVESKKLFTQSTQINTHIKHINSEYTKLLVETDKLLTQKKTYEEKLNNLTSKIDDTNIESYKQKNIELENMNNSIIQTTITIHDYMIFHKYIINNINIIEKIIINNYEVIINNDIKIVCSKKLILTQPTFQYYDIR